MKDRNLLTLEDRIKVLEKAIESHAKILARFQMTEGKDDLNIYETVGGGFEVGDKYEYNRQKTWTKMKHESQLKTRI